MKHTDGPEDPVQTISRRVKELRARKGWSATELGEQLAAAGIPWNRSVVANFENGRRTTVSVPEWLALARVLDVAPMHLLIEPEGPATPPRAYSVTPRESVSRDEARAWVRGMSCLPDTDLRLFYSEVPAEEWGYRWVLLQQDADPDGRVGDLHKWVRRGYGGYGGAAGGAGG